MGPLTIRGSRLRCLLPLVTLVVSATYGQTLPVSGQCLLSAVPNPVRAEGLAERMGDIVLSCSGSNPGAVLAGNLTVMLPVSVTNRIANNNLTTDAVLSADTGTGPVPLPVQAQVGTQSITFSGINLTIPASGIFSLRISGIRAAVHQLATSTTQQVQAFVSYAFNSSFTVNQSSAVVAMADPGLLATVVDHGQITCTGSALPGSLTLANLFAQGTNFASARLTEGFATAFQPQGPGESNGTRFLIQYSGFPAGAQLYVPDMIAGSSAAVATSAGDLGVPQAVGQYVPGSGTLLLVRVPFADAAGTGYPVSAPTGNGPILLNSVSQVALTNGSGYVVYEVADSSPNMRESAQIPTFIGFPADSAPATASESVILAPVSAVSVASASERIPRFAAVQPAGDCTVLGDCSANYFPQLSVLPNPIQLTGVAGGAMTSDPGYIPIRNVGSGQMTWTASIQYTAGAGWLSLDNSSGVNNASIRVFANPKGLTAGIYQANILIDAGALAGAATLPVTLTVSPAASTSGSGSGSSTGSGSSGSSAAPSVTVSKIVNAATFDQTPLVAGSLGTVIGSNLSGKSVAVTFDGQAAELLYTGATQINFQVPAALAGKGSATMVVTVDGASSAPQTVILAPAWPAIFSNGVLNQDYSVNAPGSAAAAGSYVSIWTTGIPDSAIVSVQIAGRQGLVPAYAGAAPGVAGVQQINVSIPADLAAGSVPLFVCAAAGSSTACSSAHVLVVGQ